jgi:hypothetical protein
MWDRPPQIQTGVRANCGTGLAGGAGVPKRTLDTQSPLQLAAHWRRRKASHLKRRDLR